MNKLPLSPEDLALVDAAMETARKPVLQLWREKMTALVAAAVLLDDGQVITSTNLIADVGSLSMCAEPSAILEANKQVDRRIAAIVAVYHDPGFDPKIVSPCGRCREFITDYAQDAYVILRDPGGNELFKVKAPELLPLKYAEYWRHRELI
jgi:cytidine deaminase